MLSNVAFEDYARGLAVMMGASQALDPGSTPGGRKKNIFLHILGPVPYFPSCFLFRTLELFVLPAVLQILKLPVSKGG